MEDYSYDNPSAQSQAATLQATNRNTKKRWAILVAALLVIGASAFYVLRSRSEIAAAEPVAMVEITAAGFSPQTITIKKGQSAVWINRETAAHQPVANPFPTGDLLPGFNSSEPLAKGDSYTATFDKSGTYPYHDALNPSAFNGVVIVE